MVQKLMTFVAPALFVGLTGCPTNMPADTGGSDGGAADAGVDAPVVQPLMEGDYVGTLGAFTDNTCGDLTSNVIAGNFTATWTQPTELTLTDTAPPMRFVTTCNLVDGVITCLPYSFANMLTGALVTIRFSGGVLMVTSPTSSRLAQMVEFDCTGPMCGTFAMTHMVPMFPCSFSFDASYARAP